MTGKGHRGISFELDIITGGPIMIISKTKYEASEDEIRELFSFHKAGNVLDIAALGNGEFNAHTK
jgi:hypothetical protein